MSFDQASLVEKQAVDPVCKKTWLKRSFQHKSLNYEKRWIRVIKLIVDSDYENIRCKLAAVDLTTHFHYHALSYVWGEDKASYPITINGQQLLVRRNLFDFLVHTKRRLHKSLYCCSVYLIDAICIDQGNVEECNHQVRQMADVYRSAASVTSWLGAGDAMVSGFLIATKLFSNRAMALDRTDRYIRTPLIASWVSEFVTVQIPAWFTEGLKRFCTVAYWTRLWIVPEFIIPPSVFLAYADQVVDGKLLHRWLLHLRNSTPYHLSIYRETVRRSGFSAFLDHSNGVGTIVTAESLRVFTDLIFYYGLQGCADERDRVFALSCLTPNYKPWLIDYGESRKMLFIRTLEFALHLSYLLELNLSQTTLDDSRSLIPSYGNSRCQWLAGKPDFVGRYGFLTLPEAHISLEVIRGQVVRLHSGNGQAFTLSRPCFVDWESSMPTRGRYVTSLIQTVEVSHGSAYVQAAPRLSTSEGKSYDFVFDTVLGVLEMLLFASNTEWGYLLNC